MKRSALALAGIRFLTLKNWIVPNEMETERERVLGMDEEIKKNCWVCLNVLCCESSKVVEVITFFPLSLCALRNFLLLWKASRPHSHLPMCLSTLRERVGYDDYLWWCWLRQKMDEMLLALVTTRWECEIVIVLIWWIARIRRRGHDEHKCFLAFFPPAAQPSDLTQRKNFIPKNVVAHSICCKGISVSLSQLTTFQRSESFHYVCHEMPRLHNIGVNIQATTTTTDWEEGKKCDKKSSTVLSLSCTKKRDVNRVFGLIDWRFRSFDKSNFSLSQVVFIALKVESEVSACSAL